jgi:hypothetical protein
VRWALALEFVAVAWAAAVWVHQRHVTTLVPSCVSLGLFGQQAIGAEAKGKCEFGQNGTVRTTHPSWEDPVAVLLAVGGVAVAVAVAIVATGRRVSE